MGCALIIKICFECSFCLDPDITWGDGIYSAYFTQLGPNPGLFTVSLQIDDNNGQAVVPVHTNITRKSYGEFMTEFFVCKKQDERDTHE